MEKIVVAVDEELEEIVPSYLSAKREDMARIREAVAVGDFETVRLAGHSLKGSGAGYGFEALTEFGRRIEQAAVTRDLKEIAAATAAVDDYVSRVEVVYAPL